MAIIQTVKCSRHKIKTRAVKPWLSPLSGACREHGKLELNGFLLSAVRARIDTANGPAWAAPDKHAPRNDQPLTIQTW